MGLKFQNSMWHCALCVVIILMGSLSLGARARRIQLAKNLTNQVNNILSTANNFHTALYNQDKNKIQTAIQKLYVSLGTVGNLSKLPQAHQIHLKKLLTATKSNIEMFRMQTGKKKVEALQQTFRNVVELANTYKVKKYRIFYCRKDKSVWLQKNRRPRNPIHPSKHGKCGTIVK